MDNQEKRKNLLSKRAKLYLVNGLFFVILLVVFFVHLAANPTLTYMMVLIYIMSLCLFVMFSLVVYYLSIIADAISRRYKDRMAEEEKDPKTK